MRVTCISDTHNKHKYIDTRVFANTDILIHAGDFTGNGSRHQAIAFLQWFEALPVRHKIFVAGNHDEICTTISWSEMLAQYAPNCHYLYNSSVTVDNLVIWGSPYSNTFGYWAFMKDDEDLSKIWKTIPASTDIVVTHGPAYGIGDLVDNDYEPGRDKHVGSKTLLAKLKSLKKLKLHAVGHIHTGYGTHFTTKYVTINGSQLNDSYEIVNLPKSIIL